VKLNKKRPINLDLMSLSYPPMAIASILHRISGVILFLFLPFILYFWAKSLKSADQFAAVSALFQGSIAYKMMLWAFAVAWIYHVLAGIRHMVMDLGWGESVAQGRFSALLVITLSIIAAISLGFQLW
jgi:succinate dehydrogenase / fumarate reductase cytochrome b subunit